MSLGAWKWVSGILSLLLLTVPVGYSWLVVTGVPAESWSWWHQLVATFFSVAFTAAIAVWLFAWQTGRITADRQKELRASQIIGIFDTWNLLGDENLKTIELPDGTEEKVLLTYLQTTIYEESIRSGLFGTAETMTLSRLSAAIHIYNNNVSQLMPVLRSLNAEGEVSDKLIERCREDIYSIQDARQTVVDAGQNLINLWSLKEVRAALAVADPDSREERDPRVAQIVEQHLPKLTPAGWKADLHNKLQKAEEAAEAGDHEAVRGLLDDAIVEAREMANTDKISESEAEGFISIVNRAKGELRVS